jgi:DNA-binding NarL/FixJ family response regulator
MQKIGRIGNVQAMLRLMQPLDGLATADPSLRKRQLLADLLRFIGEQVHGPNPHPHPRVDGRRLSPRMQETLVSLLGGDSEKQAAAKLGVSQHTVHVYVKALYKRFDVSSRSELLAKWVKKN